MTKAGHSPNKLALHEIESTSVKNAAGYGHTLMNSWSKTASAAKSGALFPTSGRSFCGHKARASKRENRPHGNYHQRDVPSTKRERTSAAARATKLRGALAALEPAAAARREGLAAAPEKARGKETHCAAAVDFADATSAAAGDTVEADKAHAMAVGGFVRRGVPGRGLGSLSR